MAEVVKLYNKGEIKPVVSKVFEAKNIEDAHDYLQKRKSIGKLVCKW